MSRYQEQGVIGLLIIAIFLAAIVATVYGFALKEIGRNERKSSWFSSFLVFGGLFVILSCIILLRSWFLESSAMRYTKYLLQEISKIKVGMLRSEAEAILQRIPHSIKVAKVLAGVEWRVTGCLPDGSDYYCADRKEMERGGYSVAYSTGDWYGISRIYIDIAYDGQPRTVERYNPASKEYREEAVSCEDNCPLSLPPQEKYIKEREKDKVAGPVFIKDSAYTHPQIRIFLKENYKYLDFGY